MSRRTRPNRPPQSQLFIGENSESMKILKMYKDLIEAIKQYSGLDNSRMSRQDALRYIWTAAVSQLKRDVLFNNPGVLSLVDLLLPANEQATPFQPPLLNRLYEDGQSFSLQNEIMEDIPNPCNGDNSDENFLPSPQSLDLLSEPFELN